MDQHTTCLERAFELAKSGGCNSIAEIRKALKSEGYSDADLTGPHLSGQLRALIRKAGEDKSL